LVDALTGLELFAADLLALGLFGVVTIEKSSFFSISLRSLVPRD
jgi:hypothetical protein